jgi:polar amino acid transport system substrate-binding protein
VDVEIRHLPSGRSLVQASNGSIDGEYARISGIESAYPGLLMVDEKLADYHFCAFTLHEELELNDWEDLSSWHTAYIKGWKILEDHTGSAKSITLVSDADSLFSMLLAGRVDVVLYDRLRGEHLLASRGIETVRIVEPPLAVRGMYLYLNLRHKALAAPLEAALRDVKEER